MNFGRLVLIRESKDHRNRKKYICLCICGKEISIYPGNLKKSKDPLCITCKIKYQSTVPEMIGKTFNRLTVVEFAHSNKNNKFYRCLCDCGNERIVNGSALRLNRVNKCSKCKIKSHIKHGKKGSSIYNIWMGMLARCNNSKNAAYKNYGGRGITVCDDWLLFENFYKDMGNRPLNMQLDRINNDKGYYKENCRWISAKENANNRRKSESRNKNKTE